MEEENELTFNELTEQDLINSKKLRERFGIV